MAVSKADVGEPVSVPSAYNTALATPHVKQFLGIPVELAGRRVRRHVAQAAGRDRRGGARAVLARHAEEAGDVSRTLAWYARATRGTVLWCASAERLMHVLPVLARFERIESLSEELLQVEPLQSGDRSSAQRVVVEALQQIELRASSLRDPELRASYLERRAENRRAAELAREWGLGRRALRRPVWLERK